MDLGRRAFMLGASTSAFLVSSKARASSEDWARWATEDTAPPVLPPWLKEAADQPSLNEAISTYQPFGTEPPTPEEKENARRVLEKVPTGKPPIEVAFYFLDVAAGKYGEDLRPYATAWPRRWNPVIVEFFTATRTLPAGDTTAWCAAFVNYCMKKSAEGRELPKGTAEPTLSAASRSFRSWAKATDKPDLGDLVVFRNKSSDAHGHVGFYMGEKNGRILVLGGNQFEGVPTRHTVNRKYLPREGNVLRFHSFRTDRRLHA